MRLKEHESKHILQQEGLPVPDGTVRTDPDNVQRSNAVVKIQRLTGGRLKDGGVQFTQTRQATQQATRELLNNFNINKVLVEEQLDGDEYYLGYTFDTKQRQPVMILSQHGGINIEEWRDADDTTTVPINPVEGLHDWQIRQACHDADIPPSLANLMTNFAQTTYKAFRNNHMRMIEINPVIHANDKLYAADALAVIDDNATHKLDHNLPDRTGLRQQTKRERRAHEINQSTHRGVAGQTYLDLDGDIAVLASGGGASVTAMDAILTYNGTLANYTEYSGNPPPDKVRELASVVLDQNGLHGCFIVGGRANFTRIDDTLKAIFKILQEKTPSYPIVIRRAGPGDEEGFAHVKHVAKQYNLNVTLFDDTTPISQAAKTMVEQAQKYGNTRQ